MTTSVRRALLAAAPLLLVATGCSQLAGEPSYSEELVVEGEEVVERVTLDDGTELVVGADISDRFVAQWRAPGGEGWTAPETVVEAGDLDASGVTLEASGDTAVVSLSWYAEDDDEREAYARVDAAVCRDVACDVVIEDVGVPMLAADGEYAVVPDETEEEQELDVDETYDLAVWQLGSDSWEPVTLDGPPVSAPTYLRPSVMLREDGTLATVHGEQGPDGCVFGLWLGEPRGTVLTEVAATEPVTGSGCTAEDVAVDGDRVSFYERSADQVVTFTETDGVWADDLPDDGLLGIDGGPGFAMSLLRLTDGSTAAVGSPDGRRVVAQYRSPDDPGWTRPVTVARARAGQRCRMAESTDLLDTPDVVYLVTCWPEDSAWGDRYSDAPPPTTGFALGSRDGRRWVTEPLDRPAYEPVVEISDLLAVASGAERSVVWRPGARAFEEVRLPLPNPHVDALDVIDGFAIRVVGNPDPDRPCRPTWDVARVDATSWEYGGAITPIESFARGTYVCYGSVSDEEGNGRVARPGRLVRLVGIGLTREVTIDGQLVRRGETWRFRPGPESAY